MWKIAAYKFFYFHIKKTWLDELIWLVSQYSIVFHFYFSILYRACSLVWFLQIWVAIYVYGTMIDWSNLIKKLMQMYIVIVCGSILSVSTVHLNGIWHLIWRYLSKPVFGGHPVLSRHYSIPRGCQLNTGFKLYLTKNLYFQAHNIRCLQNICFLICTFLLHQQ